jgi:hypothetical protein
VGTAWGVGGSTGCHGSGEMDTLYSGMHIQKYKAANG